MRQLLRRLAAPVVTSALLLPLAACGAEEASAAEVVASAPEATFEQTTAKLAMTMDMSDVPGAGGMVVEAEGAIDFESGRSTMTMDMSELLAQAGAPEGLDGDLEIRMDGTTMYMTGDTFTAGLGLEPGTWITADVNEMNEASGLQMVQQPGSNDPRQSLAMLKGVSEGGVEEVGEDEVRGAETTRYTATIDLRRAAEEAGAIVDEEAFQQFVETLGTDEIPIDVWIDDEGLMRRMDMAMPLPAEAGEGEVSIRMELFDFGADVDVAPPPAGKTRDFQELLAQAQAQPQG